MAETGAILIIESDKNIRWELETSFQDAGFETWTAESRREALKVILHLHPEGIVLSTDLRDGSGFELCREIRQKQDWTPLIMLTEKQDELDCVLSLELGADDYMAKPVKQKELTARMKAVLRRGRMCCQEKPKKMVPGLLQNGDLEVDSTQYAVSMKGKWIDLTRKEFDLLVFMMKNTDTSFTRKELLQGLSENGMETDERIVDVFISRIRQKIEPNKRNPAYIKTVRGVGYMMRSLPVPALK
ncbi:response regulator transcription factor [Alkalicoccus halolimnae]|uniref:Response regulator transcription factor n=1 Tax=Alkalicoccus halolimnae TaxID=1667239 RepID=A0A5C7F8F4_9BACI|nr:response regulator transcription factor [Alkalicoccus halolimnae]TXF85860.1 response regulator transcription factor [Alkalicoccus halolimnae]